MKESKMGTAVYHLSPPPQKPWRGEPRSGKGLPKVNGGFYPEGKKAFLRERQGRE